MMYMQSQLVLQAKYMLTHLICVGAVQQGDGNWLYDNWGSGSSLQSAVITETSKWFSLLSLFFCKYVAMHH